MQNIFYWLLTITTTITRDNVYENFGHFFGQIEKQRNGFGSWCFEGVAV